MSKLNSVGPVVYPARDLQAGIAAWTAVLGSGPVFQSADYATFTDGAVEIGLSRLPWVDHPLVFFKVDDIEKTHAELVGSGATALIQDAEGVLHAGDGTGDGTGIVDVPGRRLAAVKAADGNLVGIAQDVPVSWCSPEGNVEGTNDFDFFVGTWTIVNRQLRELFVGSDDWEVYPGTSVCRELLAGAGNMDELTFPTKGAVGATLRLFDQARKEWSLYWISGRTGTLSPPVVGTFADGRGDFYGEDTNEGRPIKSHFIWSGITADSCRWEQEFSNDGGETWETNWIMEFTRAQTREPAA
jgi:hypothetical protein